MIKIELSRLEPFVHGLGKAILAELKEELAAIQAQGVPRVIANIKHDKLGHPYAAMRTAYDNEGDGLKDGAELVLAYAPPAPQPLGDEQRAQLRDALAQALGDTYVCGRVWAAWQYGTMTADDFQPAAECDEVLDALVEATHGIQGGAA